MFRQGTVKWYDDNKHFGFITEDGSTGEDIFFHKSNILTEDQVIEKNQRVEYDVQKGTKGLEAIEIKPLNE